MCLDKAAYPPHIVYRTRPTGCPNSETHALAWAFVFLGNVMLYFAYLDEFGHIGPYIARDDPKHNDSPVFGLGGMILPYSSVRHFSTWFYQLKCSLLAWEIEQSGQHPATWEKKGASLFTTLNVGKYRQVRTATNRILNKIRASGGHVFYVGIQKNRPVAEFNSQALYLTVLGEAMKRLNQYADQKDADMVIVMDEHQDREAILTRASQAMYGGPTPRRRIIEPPFQVESERYQTCQFADWLCGLIGRIGAFQARPDDWGDMDWTQTFFQDRIDAASARSSIRLRRRPRSRTWKPFPRWSMSAWRSPPQRVQLRRPSILAPNTRARWW